MVIQTQKKQLELMHFLLMDANVCIDLECINKVLPLLMLETVPGGPNYLAGLMNLAGKSIPVIDLAMRLGMERNKIYSLNMSIILCSYKAHQVGLIVDEVIGISQINIDTLQMINDFEETSPYIATVTMDSKISLLINLNYVLKIDIYDKINQENSNEQ